MSDSRNTQLRWIAIICICVLLIGSAVWAGIDPHGVAGRSYDAALPFAYGAVLLTFAARAVLSFRSGKIANGITITAVTILVALAMLPAIIGSRP